MYTHSMSQEEPKRRRDAGMLQVTERDTIVLAWIAEQFCISFDHLQYLLGRYAKAITKTPDKLSISATRDAIGRWLQLGFIEEPRKIISGHAPYIWLSRRGLTQLGLPYAYYQPQISTIKHIYAVNAVRLYLENHGLKSTWYSERMLTKEVRPRPLPDAELRVSSPKRLAIKVIEVGFKNEATCQNALAVFTMLMRRYPTLWYFVHSETTATFEQALATLSQEVQQRATFYELDTHTQAPRVSDEALPMSADGGPSPMHTD